jgi:hypothetical protein
MKVVLVSIAVLILLASVGKDIWRRAQTKAAHSRRLVQLRRNLLVKVLGNESLVDSLIEFEQKKSANLTLEQAMESAIERWEQDNR